MRTLFAAAALILAACGGGGSTTPAPVSAQPTPPPAKATPAPGLTVFMGDSITFRWATEVLVPGSSNKGIPGETPCQMQARFDVDVLAQHPARVHILGGANVIASDTPPESECIIEMARRAVAAGIRTYVGTVTPGYDRPRAGVEYFNAQLRASAPVLGYTIVDYYPAMIDHGYFYQPYYVDTVHPSAAGYARMETVFAATVTQ
jgi:lysophospholipase L1-like esterase